MDTERRVKLLEAAGGGINYLLARIAKEPGAKPMTDYELGFQAFFQACNVLQAADPGMREPINQVVLDMFGKPAPYVPPKEVA